jgi:hypothetical protein
MKSALKGAQTPHRSKVLKLTEYVSEGGDIEDAWGFRHKGKAASDAAYDRMVASMKRFVPLAIKKVRVEFGSPLHSA